MGSGEVVVLANDDMDVEPQFLERLVEPLRGDARIGMVAGLTLQPGAGEVVDAFGIELDPTLIAFNRLRHRSPAHTPGRLLGPSGGAAAYRRSAWEAAGGFDSHFFVYGEDLDLALRLRASGWLAAAAPEARGVHLGGATTGVDSPFQRHHSGFARGFILRRYGVLRGRHAPRAFLVEALTILYGLLSARTLVPLRARIEGWRAAGEGPRLGVPAGAVDERITLRETMSRRAPRALGLGPLQTSIEEARVRPARAGVGALRFHTATESAQPTSGHPSMLLFRAMERAPHSAQRPVATRQDGGSRRSTSISPVKSIGSRVPCSRTHAAMRSIPARRSSGSEGSKSARTLA